MKPNDDKCNLLATTEKLVNDNIDESNVKNPKEEQKYLVQSLTRVFWRPHYKPQLLFINLDFT